MKQTIRKVEIHRLNGKVNDGYIDVDTYEQVVKQQFIDNVIRQPEYIKTKFGVTKTQSGEIYSKYRASQLKRDLDVMTYSEWQDTQVDRFLEKAEFDIYEIVEGQSVAVRCRGARIATKEEEEIMVKDYYLSQEQAEKSASFDDYHKNQSSDNNIRVEKYEEQLETVDVPED